MQLHGSSMDISEISNEMLIANWHDAASDVSYFNAAEGEWSRETVARERARDRLRWITNEILSRNLKVPTGNYLL